MFPIGKSLARLCLPLAILFAVPLFAAPPAFALTEEEELVEKADVVLRRLLTAEQTSKYVRDYLKRAKGVIIFPNVVKGAVLFGGEVGTGVLLAKGAQGLWSYPAFYNLGSVSFGLQLGVQSAQLALIIMTDKGLSSVLRRKVKIGGDVNAAIGPYGTGAEASTTASLGADIIAYSLNVGGFLGFSVEGSIILEGEDATAIYYGTRDATPRAVVIEGHFSNPHADALRKTLADTQ